jgi:cytidine deaminase
MTKPKSPAPLAENELVFGLVYGAGTETETMQRLLTERLRHHDYELRPIRLSSYFGDILGEDIPAESPDRVRRLQEAGDTIRGKTHDDAILARLSAYMISYVRTRDGARKRTAWLLQSFKRREEIQELRRIYGTRFIALGIHVPEPLRRRSQAHRWQRWASVTSKRYEDEAARDIGRDAYDPTEHGQDFRSAFAECDFFIDARTDARLNETLPRAIQLIFQEPFVPPHRDEQAMYHAFAAGLRSAEMGRQVGAAIVTPAGEVLAVGTNEVPSGRGGLYWSPDQPDGRDFAQQPPLDSNTLWQRRISRELLSRMAETQWANSERLEHAHDEKVRDVTEEELNSFLNDVRRTRFRDLTEFGRAVHAEMDALTSAARVGVSIANADIACTTFPCHSCTRHLVASGMRRVVFLYPYTKSLALDLHEDAVVFEPETPGPIHGKVVLEQYIGVAPRCYPQYFSFAGEQRKSASGWALQAPNPVEAVPRPIEPGGSFAFGGPIVPHSVISRLEQKAATEFVKRADEHGMNVPKPPRPRQAKPKSQRRNTKR